MNCNLTYECDTHNCRYTQYLDWVLSMLNIISPPAGSGVLDCGLHDTDEVCSILKNRKH